LPLAGAPRFGNLEAWLGSRIDIVFWWP
jgi:hypothetical protein